MGVSDRLAVLKLSGRKTLHLQTAYAPQQERLSASTNK